ncbi:unnamed protein product [Soboliphyme baturini]|uniref:ZP domain-containing protein n=1 Tax=Soboliphyme baturini TaxID=241478 RepID=A0A183IX85_9BILA|nr:unnamed protein product [Soboliphyme baturini]
MEPAMVLMFALLLVARSTTGQEQNLITDKSASCDGGFVYFRIWFQEPFTGLIYSDGYYGVSRCTYVSGNASTFYNFSVALNDCGTERMPNGSMKHALVVQRDSRILGGYDNLFVVICSPAVAAQLDVQPGQPFTIRFGGVTVDGKLRSSEVVAETVASVEYAASVLLGDGPNGPPANRPLSIGEPITYVIKIRSSQFQHMRVGNCWATDDISQLNLSDEGGCSLRKGENIWNEFRVATSPTDGDTVFYNSIKAWSFPTSNRVNIFCNMHFCQRSCFPPSCDATVVARDEPSKRGLKKRSDRVISELKATYSVVPQHNSVVITGNVMDSDTTQVGFITAAVPLTADDVFANKRPFCLTNSNFVLLLSITSSILLICCIFVTYTLFRYWRRVRWFVK